MAFRRPNAPAREANAQRRRRALPDDVAQALRSARLEAGLSHRELAARVGRSAGFVADLEAGRRCPGVQTVPLLVDALHLPDALAVALREHAQPNGGRWTLAVARALRAGALPWRLAELAALRYAARAARASGQRKRGGRPNRWPSRRRNRP